jgi:hypothetical protein
MGRPPPHPGRARASPAARRRTRLAVVVLPREGPRGRGVMDATVAAALTWRGWMLVIGLVLVAVFVVLWLIARR